MAAPSGADQQFVMLRTAMRERILEFFEGKPLTDEWRKRLPELAKQLEEILFRKFPNRNEYHNMMKEPIEPHLKYALKTLRDQNLQAQQNPQKARETTSSSGTKTPDVKNGDLAKPSASLPADDVKNKNGDLSEPSASLPADDVKNKNGDLGEPSASLPDDVKNKNADEVDNSEPPPPCEGYDGGSN